MTKKTKKRLTLFVAAPLIILGALITIDYLTLGYVKWRLNLITIGCFYLGAGLSLLSKPKTSG